MRSAFMQNISCFLQDILAFVLRQMAWVLQFSVSCCAQRVPRRTFWQFCCISREKRMISRLAREFWRTCDSHFLGLPGGVGVTSRTFTV